MPSTTLNSEEGKGGDGDMCDFAVTIFIEPSVGSTMYSTEGLLVKWSEKQISTDNIVARSHSLHICSQQKIKSVDNLVYH